MRGKEVDNDIEDVCSRITPAYAGKSDVEDDCTYKAEDHPRLCGEKLVTSGNSGVGLGSPPPMRGKVCKKVYKKKSTRITPAYAGKSYISDRYRFPR